MVALWYEYEVCHITIPCAELLREVSFALDTCLPYVDKYDVHHNINGRYHTIGTYIHTHQKK
jgi:hypothetical protein